MITVEVNTNRTLVRHHSDTYTLIQIETGIEYDEAIDVMPCRYHYKESTNLLPTDNSESLPVTNGDLSEDNK